MATEYRVWCENGDLVGHYRVDGATVEDYSAGRHVEDHELSDPASADEWASRQADALLEKTIKEAPEWAKDDYSLQVVED